MSLFGNNENIIFFLIYFFIVAIIILSCVAIIVLILKLLWKLFRKIFNIEKRVKRTDKNIIEEPKTIKEDYNKEIVDRSRNQALGNFGGSFIKDKKEEVEEEKDVVKEQREKGEKDIAEGLSQLKKYSSEKEPSKSSGLPSREEKGEEGGVSEKIKIPRAKKYSSEEEKEEEKEEPSKLSGLPSRDEKSEGGVAGEKTKEEKAGVNSRIEHLKSSLAGESVDKDLDVEKRMETGEKFKDKNFINWVAKKIKGEKNKGWFGSLFSKKESVPKMINRDISSFSGGIHDTESRKIAKSFMGNILEKSITRKEASNTQKDSSIFAGKSEISRLKLRHELRDNPKVWEAQRQAGLTLSSTERAKLEKEVFSQALGGNISKTDMKWGVKKLNQKMLGAKNIAEKTKLRKQIKFIKKIGGIR